jgi:2-succinyl-5-enolpyruvyl-6-hydroxy-3-cyclohexene-1-carboxylate synthase
MSDAGCAALRWCAALLSGLTEAGLSTVVLSPGSRSTPMVLAAQRRHDLVIRPIVDERSAAFFALGVARASQRPVACLATSGSAPAHWYPAVIEAHESGVPLILISADRPPLLRHWGANQTIDQIRLFGSFVRETHDPGLPRDDAKALKAMRALGLRAGTVCLAPRPGPVHLNLPFAEPLVPRSDCSPAPQRALDATPRAAPLQAADESANETDSAPLALPPGSGLVVCGPGRFGAELAPLLCRCAARLGLPVLADPLSGLRFGPSAEDIVTGYDALLRNGAAADALRPDWVLRLGRAPVSRRLCEWLDGLPTVLIDPTGGWSDPNHDVQQRLCMEPSAFFRRAEAGGQATAGPGQRERWLSAERRIRALAQRFLATAPWFEGHVVSTLLRRLPPGDGLLCANSMPIRQLDTWSGTRAGPLSLFGNRGASGIDGQLSTLAGLNQGGPPTTGLIGDLSLCHDVGGLPLADGLKRPILVVNNGGGRIFDYLPQRGLPGFEALWRTPVDVDLGDLARAFGLVHRPVEDADALAKTLTQVLPIDRPRALIELRIDADRSRALHLSYWQQVADARLIR